MLKAFGIDLGTTGLVITPATIIIGLVIGVVATMVSGFVPARRATRIEPVTAMRDAVPPGVGHLRKRRIVGSLALMGVGLVALFFGLFGGIDSTSAAASLLGLGALLMMFGVAFLAPLLVRPLARVLGAPLAGSLTGKLARENAIRQPQRTAVTAAALMVGLALVVLVTVFAAGIRGVGRQDDRRPGHGRADRPEPGRLLADPAGGRRHGRGRSTASATSRRCASRPASSTAMAATRP